MYFLWWWFRRQPIKDNPYYDDDADPVISAIMVFFVALCIFAVFYPLPLLKVAVALLFSMVGAGICIPLYHLFRRLL
jgi:hypothetical protein